MRCFKFRVSSKLNAADRRRGELRFAHVWVNEKVLDKAEALARALLAEQGWAIESVELSMAPSPQEIAALDPIHGVVRLIRVSPTDEALPGHGESVTRHSRLRARRGDNR